MEQNISYPVSNYAAKLPPPLLTHPSCDADGGYLTRLSDHDVAMLALGDVVVQNVLGNLCGLAAPCRPLNDGHLIRLYGV